MKIFVQIASYRDPELLPTIRDCISKAKHPENLTFGICWQRDENESMEEFANDERFKILDYHWSKSKGLCWARSEIQKLWNEEEYTLQLDSHHRFLQDWDVELIEMMKLTGSKKPIITAYAGMYEPKTNKLLNVEPYKMVASNFTPGGTIMFRPHEIPNWKELDKPIPARFVSGHFFFTIGKHCEEYKYDPNIYFAGDEISLSIRSYTLGYDLFHPHKTVVWHEYTREGKKRHWDDSQDWKEKDDASYARFRKLFGMDPGCGPCQRKALAPYAFGTVRSLEDFERYAGLKFSTRQIHKETLDNKFPPIKGDYESGLASNQKHCIDVYRGSLTETDYDSFAVAFLDENGEDIYRKDCDKMEINSVMNLDHNDKFIHIWRDFEAVERPVSWRVWPHSISKGWMERIEQKIQYE